MIHSMGLQKLRSSLGAPSGGSAGGSGGGAAEQEDAAYVILCGPYHLEQFGAFEQFILLHDAMDSTTVGLPEVVDKQ